MFEHPSHNAMQPNAGEPVTAGEVFAALSCALDITEGALPGHAARCCFLGMRIGQQLGLTEELLGDLYYALLLKDIGCSSNASRMAQAFAADDQTVKRHFKLIDKEKLGKPNREALGFVWNNVAPGTNFWNRTRQMYRMIRRPGDLTAETIEARCERGALILHKFGMSIETCAAVYSLDEHWNGRGLPDHLVGGEIPLLGRICAVAQHLDLFRSEFGMDRALSTLQERSGSWFDPESVRAAVSLAGQRKLWDEGQSNDPTALQSAVLALDPHRSQNLASYDLNLICSGFADVIDAKSPFAFRHSVATTEIAALVCNALGLATERREVVRRAAMLHDIGMLSVSNAVLDKPGRLTAEEWAVVHRHPLLSHDILSRVRAFQDVAQLAAQHHERLDGSGYPHHLRGEQLSLEARVLAVADVFSAMMQRRSYREDLTVPEMETQLYKAATGRLDPNVVDAAMSVLDELALLPIEDVPAMSAGSVPPLPLFDPPPFRFEERL